MGEGPWHIAEYKHLWLQWTGFHVYSFCLLHIQNVNNCPVDRKIFRAINVHAMKKGPVLQKVTEELQFVILCHRVLTLSVLSVIGIPLFPIPVLPPPSHIIHTHTYPDWPYSVVDQGGSMGLVEPPFLPQIHPECPWNGVSDVPNFKILEGACPADHPSLSHLRRSQIRTPLHKIPHLPQLLIPRSMVDSSVVPGHVQMTKNVYWSGQWLELEQRVVLSPQILLHWIAWTNYGPVISHLLTAKSPLPPFQVQLLSTHTHTFYHAHPCRSTCQLQLSCLYPSSSMERMVIHGWQPLWCQLVGVVCVCVGGGDELGLGLRWGEERGGEAEERGGEAEERSEIFVSMMDTTVRGVYNRSL